MLKFTVGFVKLCECFPDHVLFSDMILIVRSSLDKYKKYAGEQVEYSLSYFFSHNPSWINAKVGDFVSILKYGNVCVGE